MRVLLIGFLSTAYPAAKAFLQATKLAIYRQLRQLQPDPFAEDAEIEEPQYVGKTPMAEQAAMDDHNMVYYSAKTVLYGWSAYHLATNNANPIDALVACAATLETAHDIFKAATHR